MKHLKNLYQALSKQEVLHEHDVFNYTVPLVWNTFGFANAKILRNKEMILNPYEFYTYALDAILKTPRSHNLNTQQDDWLKSSICYALDLRTFSSWDHDRSGAIEDSNMYQLSDSGTFLKAIILLPLLARAGVNTLILHNYLSLSEQDATHDYADPHAILNYRDINPNLFDPMVNSISIENQMHAFIEACHYFGMHVVLNFAPAVCGQHSTYQIEHPEWFYWIHSEDKNRYHTPQAAMLPKGCTPSEQICKILYDSEDVLTHLSMFSKHPKKLDRTQTACVVAPLISDQINATSLPDSTCTLLRFYEDLPAYRPKHIQAPYMLCDTMRTDLFPQKKKMKSLWDEIGDATKMWLTKFNIDGFYIRKTYLLPQALLQDLTTLIHSHSPHTICMAEYMDIREYETYKALGFDAVSGNSGYNIHDVYDYQYHNFAYSLLTTPIPQFAASEFLDTPRICAYEQGETLAQLLSIMNLFLPNAIPCFMGGQFSLEKQPQYLSEFADQKHLLSLDKQDPRYHKQAMLHHYTYNYIRSDYHVFINLLEKVVALRTRYLDAIIDPMRCFPICFDDPKDMGIAFAYTLENKALLVVCNTNIHTSTLLHIHTETMLWKLPFQWQKMHQIFASYDEFTYDVHLDSMHRIALEFAPGEVKFIEVT